MKITICGSLKFYNQMVEIQKKLEETDNDVFIPVKAVGVDYWAEDNSGRVNAKKGMELMSEHMKKIEKSDAILVVNITKNDIENYIGANTFAEMVFSDYKKKKIFVLNPLSKQAFIKDEIESMETVVINGDLSRIK